MPGDDAGSRPAVSAGERSAATRTPGARPGRGGRRRCRARWREHLVADAPQVGGPRTQVGVVERVPRLARPLDGAAQARPRPSRRLDRGARRVEQLGVSRKSRCASKIAASSSPARAATAVRCAATSARAPSSARSRAASSSAARPGRSVGPGTGAACSRRAGPTARPGETGKPRGRLGAPVVAGAAPGSGAVVAGRGSSSKCAGGERRDRVRAPLGLGPRAPTPGSRGPRDAERGDARSGCARPPGRARPSGCGPRRARRTPQAICTNRAAGRACRPCSLRDREPDRSASPPPAPPPARVGGARPTPRCASLPARPPRASAATASSGAPELRGHGGGDGALDERGLAEQDVGAALLGQQVQRHLRRQHRAAEVHQHQHALGDQARSTACHDHDGVGADRMLGQVETAGRLDAHVRPAHLAAPARPRPRRARSCARRHDPDHHARPLAQRRRSAPGEPYADREHAEHDQAAAATIAFIHAGSAEVEHHGAQARASRARSRRRGTRSSMTKIPGLPMYSSTW